LRTRCIIIDDEPIAIDVIKSHLKNFKEFDVIAECDNAIEAIEIINKKQIDLMFLDIKMPQLSGIEFLKIVNTNIKVILTTAYRDYAIDAYQLDVIDYLLKPISFERFTKAINKFYTNKTDNAIQKKSEQILHKAEFIYVKEGKETHKIYLNDILYVESFKEYIIIHLLNKEIKVIYKIGEFELLLPPTHFVRIHKSYIISINKIASFSSNSVLIDQIKLPIGGTYSESVKKALKIK